MPMTTETIWLGIGFLGQGLFFGRWLVQWIASERTAESRVPISFWYMSLIGGLITLAYAIYRKDPVFISGQALGAVVYVRNLVLIQRADQTKSAPRPQA
ncbi:MAG: lipid A biosynthesis protein [Nitrospira sp.]|nr:lipid A biosynthesis protein [Nitrospira sp.]